MLTKHNHYYYLNHRIPSTQPSLLVSNDGFFLHHHHHHHHLNSVVDSHASRSTICRQKSAPNDVYSGSNGDVLSNSDIIVGAIMAVLLAFTASFLQGRRNQNDFVLSSDVDVDEFNSSSSSSRKNDVSNNDNGDDANDNDNDGGINDNAKESTTTNSNNNSINTKIVFGKESWEEIKRPDNYVLYNKKLNDRKRDRKNKASSPFNAKQERWVVIALLAVFVPIFGIELFFALSRQIICGGGNGGDGLQSDWSQLLCAPVVTTTITTTTTTTMSSFLPNNP